MIKLQVTDRYTFDTYVTVYAKDKYHALDLTYKFLVGAESKEEYELVTWRYDTDRYEEWDRAMIEEVFYPHLIDTVERC